jgi:hypothetical protein
MFRLSISFSYSLPFSISVSLVCFSAPCLPQVGREAYDKLQDLRQRTVSADELPQDLPTTLSVRPTFSVLLCQPASSTSSSSIISSSASSSISSSSSSSSSGGLGGSGGLGSSGGDEGSRLNVGTSADGLCALLCKHKGLGPTMSKMFLVTTHLRYPELKLLDQSCQVRKGLNRRKS